MCGRFAVFSDTNKIREYFECDFNLELKPRFNIAPSQDIPIIKNNTSQQRELVTMRWGLIPSWMKAENISSKLINARVETAHEKPSFRHAFKKQRCLIIADGFYEWKKIDDQKQPFYIHRDDNNPLAFAGLWEHWLNKDDSTFIDSCTILTQDADKQLAQLHNRMPVMLHRDQFDDWLNTENHDVNELQELLIARSAPLLELYPVTIKINNPRFDQPEAIQKQ